MKLIILILLTPFLCLAQYPEQNNSKKDDISNTNFIYENHNLKWQKIFNTSITPTKINLHLKNNGFHSFIEGDLIEFNNEYILNDLKDYGYSWGSFPTYTNDGAFSGFIELKDSKYRVTVNSNKIKDVLNPDIYNELETWIFRNSVMRSKKVSLKVLEMYNAYFSNIFTLNNTQTDW